MATIVIVDDEYGLRELMSVVVEELGYEVKTATNGVEALALIEQTRPVLVISDVMMPVMDGYTLLQNIRLKEARWPTLKVVLVSAAFMGVWQRGSGAAQADEYIAKPFALSELKAVVERVLSK